MSKSDESYRVKCDQCDGARRVSGFICGKCGGEGEITIFRIPVTLTFSQRVAKQAALILLLAVLAGIAIGIALHRFRIL